MISEWVLNRISFPFCDGMQLKIKSDSSWKNDNKLKTIKNVIDFVCFGVTFNEAFCPRNAPEEKGEKKEILK